MGKSPLRSWLLQSYFDEVVSVNFLDNTQVTDDGLAHLENLTALQEVWLDNTRITDAGLANLEGLTHCKGFTSAAPTSPMLGWPI